MTFEQSSQEDIYEIMERSERERGLDLSSLHLKYRSSNIPTVYDDVEDGNIRRYQRSGLDREQEVYKTVHQELCNLSSDLKHRNEKSIKEDVRLNDLRLDLEKRERRMRREVERLVESVAKEREQRVLKETKEVVGKYELALEQLSKENRRVQISLKEMVQSNRILREQSKSVEEQLVKRDASIKDLIQQSQRHSKELLEARVNPIDTFPAEIFNQMKKFIAVPVPRNDNTTQTTKGYDTMDVLLFMLQDTPNLSTLYTSVTTSYEYIESIHQVEIKEKYLSMIYAGIGRLKPSEAHDIASLVYATLSKGITEIDSPRIILLLYLIPLKCIKQPEVLEALLEGLRNSLIESGEARRLLLQDYDAICLLRLVKPKEIRISDLASSLFLLLSSEDRFLGVCATSVELLRSTARMSSDLSVKTMENVAVVMQMLGKIGLLPLDFAPLVDSLYLKHISDFCDLNLKALRHLLD